MSEGHLWHLAAFASRVDVSALAAEVADKAKACLLYGLAVGIASAWAEAPLRAARALDREGTPAEGTATRLLDGQRVTPGCAVLANAALFHSRIQEDSHPAGHMGVVVLPAALAMAEDRGASGAECLAAIIAGYEVALRIGRDHAAALSARGFRTTPVYGVFGAAAATARLCRLGPDRTTHALALAANFAGGLREFSSAGSGEYPFQAGIAARDGLTAALLAAEGVEGAASNLEGEAGFYRAFADRSAGFGRRLGERLGEEYEMLRVGYKPYPTCQFHRGIVRGLLTLRAAAGGVLLRRLEVRLHPFEADFLGVRYAGPFRSFAQTFMSAPFCAALAWTRGEVTLAGLHDFTDPGVLAIVPRVEVVADPVRARYQPRLSLELVDGGSLGWEETEGEEAYLLTWPEATRMTHALMAEMGLPPERARDLVHSVESLGSHPTVAPVIQSAVAAIAGVRSPASRPPASDL
jgi:2-methylcitrate dehydratase PrpD